MSREIKFRAWDKKIKRMADVLLIDWLNGLVDLAEGAIERELDEVELMQYTGLKDKNGAKVFAGDMLRVIEVSEHEYLEYVSPVEYIESGFLVTEPIDTQVPLACFYNLDKTYPLFEIEVIGNIFENPELLEADGNG